MKQVMLLTLMIAIGIAGCGSDRDGSREHGLLTAPPLNDSASLGIHIGPSDVGASLGSARVVLPPSAALAGTTVSAEWDAASYCLVKLSGPPLQDDAILSMQKPPDAPPGRTYRIVGFDNASGAWVDLGGTEVNGRVEIADRFVQFSVFDLDDID